MNSLTPRLIGPPEARTLGIQSGWYGTKVSGTIVTTVSATQKECFEAIRALSKFQQIAEHGGTELLAIKTQPMDSIYNGAKSKLRSASQIAHKPASLD